MKRSIAAKQSAPIVIIAAVISSIMSRSSSQYICVGTKRINEDVCEGDAIISLFRLRPVEKTSPRSSHIAANGGDLRSPSPRQSFDDTDTVDECLHLMVTDGDYTFYKR